MGEVVVQKQGYFIWSVGLEVFWLTIRNRGKERKGGYRDREEVGLIDMGDYSEWWGQSQRDAFKAIFIIISLFDKIIKQNQYIEGLIIGTEASTDEV